MWPNRFHARTIGVSGRGWGLGFQGRLAHRDAILYSVGANAVHGQRRTNADKRKAVMTLLEDDEWRGNSNEWLAEKAAVSIRTILRYRESLTSDNVTSEQPATRTYTNKHGTTATMNTANIGKSQARSLL